MGRGASRAAAAHDTRAVLIGRDECGMGSPAGGDVGRGTCAHSVAARRSRAAAVAAEKNRALVASIVSRPSVPFSRTEFFSLPTLPVARCTLGDAALSHQHVQHLQIQTPRGQVNSPFCDGILTPQH